MRYPFLITLVLALLFLSSPKISPAQANPGESGPPANLVSEPDSTYTALRAARPDGRRVTVTELVLERDVFRFRFESGTFHFLTPVAGRTVGAVFTGQGSYHLSPASERERRQLALVTGEDDFKVLSDTFSELVLLFADQTAAQIEAAGTVETGSPDDGAVAIFEEHFKWQRKDFHENFQLRLLIDLLHSTPVEQGVFMALLDGKSHPPALAAVDPSACRHVGIARYSSDEDTVFYVADEQKRGYWYLSDRRHELEKGPPAPQPSWIEDAHYAITTTVERDDDLRGVARIRFKPTIESLRVLPIGLMSKLRLEAAAFSLDPPSATSWRAAALVQEDEKEYTDPAIVFPEPLPVGRTVWLELRYAGDEVLIDVGGENYVVRARQNWYPNLGTFNDLATYELTYEVPPGNEVVSVGELVSSGERDGRQISVWRTDIPVRVAGFNYGRFKRFEKSDGGLTVAVYTNPGTPDVIRRINEALGGGRGAQSAFNDSVYAPLGGGLVGRVSTENLAESALTDGLNAARVATAFFGPLPQSQVAITQQSQFSFGQSWPSLIFMPYLAFLPSTHRAQLMELGGSYVSDATIESLGYHEFAHQWWGHLLGWRSYRDQWLSEGLAELTAAIVVQHTQGWEAYDRQWEEAEKRIFMKPPGSLIASHEAGPITQGWRLSTHRSIGAYSALIYQKGAYIGHMLRMLMWDHTAENPDARFIAMMKDFVATYRYKNPSTADFQAVVEKHMTPEMNARGDGKMDWFFDQWLDGTAIPRLEEKVAVSKAGPDQYRFAGTVSQQEVPADFITMLPLYIDFGKGQLARLGVLRLIGPTTQQVDLTLKLPKKPKGLLINAHHDVLARR